MIGKWPALYRLPAEQRSKQSSLDPNHSHFILADNGTQLQFATEIEFRAKLENEISQWKTNTGSGECFVCFYESRLVGQFYFPVCYLLCFYYIIAFICSATVM